MVRYLAIGLFIIVFMTIQLGCNEKTVKPEPENSLFPTGSISEEIAIPEKEITKILRFTGNEGNTLGYHVQMKVVSRSGPFDIQIILNPEACVLRAEVLKYTARRGRKVRSKTFTSQFTGKCSEDNLVLGKDIDAVSGATLSAETMTKGVKKAISIIENLQNNT